MNRRSTLKRIGGIGVLIASSFSVYKWKTGHAPLHLDDLSRHKELIAEIAETIIPRTDSPGAKDVGVEYQIIKFIKDCSDTKTQREFMNGLASVEEYADNSFERPFSDCNRSEKESVLMHFENSVQEHTFLGKVRRKLFGESFITIMKRYTVISYCTSKLGASQGLVYDYIPIHFISCTTLAPGQKSWATE